MEKKYLPPIQALPEEFPADGALPEGCRELKLTDDPLGVEFLSRVIYARREGVELNLQLFLPMKGLMPDGTRWPLVVFIPGSAFMQQNLDQMVPELCDFAKRGWAVARLEQEQTSKYFCWRGLQASMSQDLTLRSARSPEQHSS